MFVFFGNKLIIEYLLVFKKIRPFKISFQHQFSNMLKMVTE